MNLINVNYFIRAKLSPELDDLTPYWEKLDRENKFDDESEYGSNLKLLYSIHLLKSLSQVIVTLQTYFFVKRDFETKL